MKYEYLKKFSPERLPHTGKTFVVIDSERKNSPIHFPYAIIFLDSGRTNLAKTPLPPFIDEPKIVVEW